MRQADAARTDYALIEGHLEFIMGHLSRAPTRAYLCRTLMLAMVPTWLLLAALLLMR